MNEMKKINIHHDYIMFQLMSQLRTFFHIVVSYMQESTPYGKEYEEAYWLCEKIQQQLNAMEDKLAKCVEFASTQRKEVK